jgi:hypothetical protein
VLVLVHFGINGCFGCWDQERTALLQLKASMINYTSNYFYDDYFLSWDSANTESDCCDWERVKCNITTGSVIQLYLNDTISFDGEHVDAQNFCFDGPRINPRTAWARAGFV